MNYIFVMSLSGSVMLLLYLFQRDTLGKNLSKRWQYLFLKIVLIYYLVPLPWLGTFYRKFLKVIRKKPPQYFHQYFRNEKVLYQSGHGMAISVGYQRRLVVVGFWCFIVFLAFVVLLIRYIKNYGRLLRCKNEKEAAEEEEILNRKRQEWHIKRKIALKTCDGKNVAFTMGIWKPVIVCKMPEKTIEKEMLLTHELVHIKRYDLLWKIAGSVIQGLHWFNPLVYLFRREFEKVCEESCDEMTTEDYMEEERFLYALMLMERSAGQGQRKGWKTELSKNAEIIQERMELIMDGEKRKSKWNGLLAILLIGGMTVLNSVTVLAYEEVKVLQVTEDKKIADIQTMNVETCFTPYGFEGENLWVDTILYDKQFEDEAGNIYPVKEGAIPYADCSHVFISGVYKDHNLKEGGGCTIDYYEGQYCNKCGYCVIGEKIGESSFVKCLH